MVAAGLPWTTEGRIFEAAGREKLRVLALLGAAGALIEAVKSAAAATYREVLPAHGAEVCRPTVCEQWY
ncbi:MAG: hypothetical protein AMXMBFR61_25180 [Fimbriimonadales bacterium]